jgi:hypothetical protein
MKESKKIERPRARSWREFVANTMAESEAGIYDSCEQVFHSAQFFLHPVSGTKKIIVIAQYKPVNYSKTIGVIDSETGKWDEEHNKNVQEEMRVFLQTKLKPYVVWVFDWGRENGEQFIYAKTEEEAKKFGFENWTAEDGKNPSRSGVDKPTNVKEMAALKIDSLWPYDSSKIDFDKLEDNVVHKYIQKHLDI